MHTVNGNVNFYAFCMPRLDLQFRGLSNILLCVTNRFIASHVTVFNVILTD